MRQRSGSLLQPPPRKTRQVHRQVLLDHHLSPQRRVLGQITRRDFLPAACNFKLVGSLRREKGWTQAALAQAAGVGREWVIHLEKARPGVELGLVMATLKALVVRLRIEPPAPVETDIDLSQILGESKPPNSAP
jgi:DNA-binding XRE family transcriptional regulator